MAETEVKIIANEYGNLFAVLPNGEAKTILVDVPGSSHYGLLTIGSPTEGAQEFKVVAKF